MQCLVLCEKVYMKAGALLYYRLRVSVRRAAEVQTEPVQTSAPESTRKTPHRAPTDLRNR